MGGLDCRYVISHIQNKSYTIKGLATIAMPHRGSSFMDYCRDKLGVGHLDSYLQRESDDPILNSIDSDYFEGLMSHTKQQYLSSIVKPVDALAFTNLTREYCAAFNKYL